MAITTAGSLLIRKMLPTQESRDRYDIHSPLNKDGVKHLVNNILQHGGEKGPETINELGKLFFNKATEMGATTPLSDYENDSDERQSMFSEFESKVSEVLKKDLPKMEQAKALDAIASHYSGKMSKHNLAYMLSRGSTAARMANTGARGTPSQLSQGTASPMMALDVKGVPIPIVIKHSFAEGLSNAEHLAMSYGGRASTVMSQLSTEKPGALFKKLTPNVFHEIISMEDCGTKNGVPIPVTDKLSVLGRYEAGTNRLVNEARYTELRNSHKKTVILRSPMTCVAKDGICQKCYGLGANSELPLIGHNVGVIAAQSVSEVLTQAMLSTKHQGGVAGRQRNPYEEANNILSNPENFQDEATIAETNGKVEKLQQTSLKDWEVHIHGVKHFIPNFQEPLVKVGDKVRVGDPISTGTLNPRTLVSLKGSGAGRVYLANKMRDVYSRNAQLDPRHFDVIARNMVKYHEVVEPGKSDLIPGDKIEINNLAAHLQLDSSNVGVDSAVGRTLAEGMLDVSPGTVLTQNLVDDLKSHGIEKVLVDNSGIKTKALVPGLQSLKLLDRNWVSKLSFNNLHKVIAGAAALGSSSPIHSNDPVASYMMGSEFGEGENGKY
jgi:DNA-directed RNA polymerase subunit beta'